MDFITYKLIYLLGNQFARLNQSYFINFIIINPVNGKPFGYMMFKECTRNGLSTFKIRYSIPKGHSIQQLAM